MVSPEAQKYIEGFASLQRSGEPPPLEQWRRDWDRMSRERPLPEGVRCTPVTINGIACEWIDAQPDPASHVFLLVHGGGFTSGTPATERKLAILLARAAGMRVLTPDYRLAPEHPFPAALDDVLAIYAWLTGSGGVRPEHIVIGGGSAGANIALSALLALRQAGTPLPCATVLLSPWTDLTMSGASHAEQRPHDIFVTPDSLVDGSAGYAGERDPADSMISPLFADLSGLPPMMIHVGGSEVLLDDSRLLAERAAAAGVEVRYKAWPGLWHCFPLESPNVPEAAEAIAEIGAFITELR